MNRKMEIRSNSVAPSASEGRLIEGYAIVWGVESRVLWDFDGEFVEIIEREAVSDELLARCDVKALFNHYRGDLLARCVNGNGTLTLTRDNHGLKFAFEAPNTTVGNDVLELVKRGDITGCSFAFIPGKVSYYTREDGTKLHRVHEIKELFDVSVVVDPAYSQTSVDARSFDVEKPKGLTLEECKNQMKVLFNL